MAESHHARHLYDGGFTLIELMVTLLIMAILLAIAIPTFLEAARAAAGRVAQANSNTAPLDSQNTFSTARRAYQPTTTVEAALHSVEPNLTFQTNASNNHSQVSLYVATDLGSIILAVQSNTEKHCWYTIINAKAEQGTLRTPYHSLPSAELGVGTYFGEAKVQRSGFVPPCRASVVATASPGYVSYQKGKFPTL